MKILSIISLGRPWRFFILKAYVTVALVVAAVLSPLALSFMPALLLLWYVYSWRWPVSTVVNLLTEYFMLFALALLYSSAWAPLLAWLVSLPVLLLVNHALRVAARFQTGRSRRYGRCPTDLAILLSVIAVSLLLVSGLLGSLALLLAAATAVICLAGLGLIIRRRVPLMPVRADRMEQRMVAGTKTRLSIKLTVETEMGGILWLRSPSEWLKVTPEALVLNAKELEITVSMAPVLSGPQEVRLEAQVIDRWGLTRTSFEVVPLDLYVIPRARYADWLARKYLAETRPGTLPLVASIGSLKPMYGLRQGVEYYGSQVYQPGDSLKTIDWKHSLMFNELISKEFVEFQGQSAVLLVNLAAGNETEADQLAYKIIVSAISLSQDSIPAALAAYDHEGIRRITSALQSHKLVLEAMEVARQIVTFTNPRRYLNPPDVARLRAGISRLRFAESRASKVLSGLLQLEYRSLSLDARQHPATRALAEVFTRADRQSSVLVISHFNHDAEAMAFNKFSLTRRGNPVITV